MQSAIFISSSCSSKSLSNPSIKLILSGIHHCHSQAKRYRMKKNLTDVLHVSNWNTWKNCLLQLYQLIFQIRWCQLHPFSLFAKNTDYCTTWAVATVFKISVWEFRNILEVPSWRCPGFRIFNRPIFLSNCNHTEKIQGFSIVMIISCSVAAWQILAHI